MIQRIQTVYLILAGLLVAFLLKLNFAEIVADNDVYMFSAKGIFNNETLILNGLPFTIFIGIIVLLHFIVITMYKKRTMQIRITTFTIILLFVLLGLFFYFTYTYDLTKVAFKIPIIFPLVAIILDFLAIRAIKKDENLIRSLNRIR